MYGKIIQTGGAKFTKLLDENLKEASKWLRQDSKEEKKYVSLLILKQHLINFSYISFQFLINLEGLFHQTLQLLRYKFVLIPRNSNPRIKQAALGFLDETIK